MNKFLILITFCLAFPIFCLSQKKRIAVVGSSTSYGFGASPIDSSYVNLVKKYFKALGEIDTIYNLGIPSSTTYNGLPTGTPPPEPYDTVDFVDTAHNITKALKDSPDVVIINFPTNDLGRDFPMAIFLSNLRTMYNTVIKAGRICYVTTTQPRNTLSPAERLTLVTGRDSILLEFGSGSLDFYDPLKDPDTDPSHIGLINPLYNADDVHPNNAGHQLLFQVVKNAISANLAIAPLALSVTSFSAKVSGAGVMLDWTVVNEENVFTSEIQRSSDGLSFYSIHQEIRQGSALPVSGSWEDPDPPAGKNFYRVKITTGTSDENYSPVIDFVSDQKELIRRISRSVGGMVWIELNVFHTGSDNIAVYNISGKLVYRQLFEVTEPSASFSIPLSGIPPGLYFIKVTAADRDHETRPFSKLPG